MFIEIPVRENNSRFTYGSTSHWEEIKKNLLNTSGTMGKLILQYITEVSALLSQITAYREKKTELRLQA